MIHEGLATHGMAWFSSNQTAGKGQRGKHWESKSGENIAMSVVLVPPAEFIRSPFLFNAWIALICREYISEIINETVSIKWPNDLIVCDRKAGGILIENKYRGNNWCWSVVGIGININQLEFSKESKYPISLKQITGITYHPEELARRLHQKLLIAFNEKDDFNSDKLWKYYHQHLYKIGKKVFFKKEETILETLIIGVNQEGLLMTKDSVERTFQFGEIEWLMQ